ncbi:hypothetical protein L9F63_024754 [Diploptera punctata]|uniref:Uncharacterized protein n=1 Tax=Diploptera punctata TaxID=6984 RepID=A0AAD7ZEM4_DIPPU|nr:hypothetical protein L9F63_024754 [Diploptera punctata]
MAAKNCRWLTSRVFGYQISQIDTNVLSKDQQYLLDISKAIKSGTCKEDLAVRDPGHLSHSRFLTKANRSLRLYISEESPSPELHELVLFILKSYMPMWFTIKTSKLVTDGQKLVCQAIQSTRYLLKLLLDLVDTVIERIVFFAHPEHVLLTMTLDDKKHIRELGLRRILKARQIDARRKTVNTFTPPKINFNMQEYSEMINCMDSKLSSPHCWQKLVMMRSNRTSPMPQTLIGTLLSSHSQFTCRVLNAGKVCGAESRVGFIRTTLLSRSSMSNFTGKSVLKVSSATI